MTLFKFFNYANIPRDKFDLLVANVTREIDCYVGSQGRPKGLSIALVLKAGDSVVDERRGSRVHVPLSYGDHSLGDLSVLAAVAILDRYSPGPSRLMREQVVRGLSTLQDRVVLQNPASSAADLNRKRAALSRRATRLTNTLKSVARELQEVDKALLALGPEQGNPEQTNHKPDRKPRGRVYVPARGDAPKPDSYKSQVAEA